MKYLQNRLAEKSTWGGIGLVVAGAAKLDSPYSWIAIAVGVIACLVPLP